MNKDRKKELDTLLEAERENEKENKNDDEKDEEEEKSNQDEENGDEEEKNEDEEDSKEEDEGEEKEKKKEENSDEEDEDSDEEKVETDEKETDKKDKWHGKSREEVIKMYEELEKKPAEKKNSDTIPEKKKETKRDDSSGGIDVPSDEELSQMTPKQFAEWMVSTVKNIVSETYDTRTQMRDSVTQEIRDAQKEHPLLKSSPEYRELVLSLIDTASQKGTAMSLKDACEKVDGFVGKVKGDTKVSETEKIRLKKAKAQVERGAGAPTSHGEDKGAEERRLEQIFGTSGSKSPLGGLGV